MRVLVHMCCANCACYPVQWLLRNGHEVRGLFYNPNIHPYQEYNRRREAVQQFAEEFQVPVIYINEYPLEEFFRRMVFREGRRCWVCYQWRLETTARMARRGRYDAFTTTLLYSIHQQHDWIRQVAQEEAGVRGLEFFYEDFRRGWKEGIQRSVALGLYRQSYCGCIYSERDRFMRPVDGKSKGTRHKVSMRTQRR